MWAILLLCWIIPIVFHYTLFYILFKLENEGEETTVEDLFDFYKESPFEGQQWPVLTPGVNLVILLLEIAFLLYYGAETLIKAVYNHIKDYKV